MVFELAEIGDEGLDFEIQQNKEHFVIDQEDCSLTRDVEVRGRLTYLSGDVFFEGKVCTELTLKCSRCLDPVNQSVKCNVKSHFVPQDGGAEASGEVELHSADIDNEVYTENRIDLTQSVRDGILLAVPAFCLCREDCQGICPRCGLNRNRESCDCSLEPSVDPRLEILKTLKEKLK
ncbi:hypothetical protein UZ36_00430 [Candidatus Nitromaritima sp. SCGC AAA799-C22]|nr:hypothetical protein UZ36_00430 [Candidatus Nitromaritima sp. SCGC AAA799-C22]